MLDSKVVWKEGMAFDAHLEGFSFSIDAAPDKGGEGRGPKPKGLTLTSLAGCTGMDVISILRKMRQPVSSLEVSVRGEEAEEHPVRFTRITVRYELEGEGLDTERVRRAVYLSEHRYCGISATLRDSLPLETEIVVNGEEQEPWSPEDR